MGESASRSNIVNIQSSESEQEDNGEDVIDNSSVLDSSSDHPAGQVVPSEGPVREYMGGSVQQPSGQVPSASHIPGSVRDTHVNVGTFATAGVCTTSESAGPSLLCSAHPTSWQPGCAVCDVAVVHASKAPVYDPKMAVADRLLGRIAKPQLMLSSWGLLGSRWPNMSAISRNQWWLKRLVTLW